MFFQGELKGMFPLIPRGWFCSISTSGIKGMFFLAPLKQGVGSPAPSPIHGGLVYLPIYELVVIFMVSY